MPKKYNNIIDKKTDLYKKRFYHTLSDNENKLIDEYDKEAGYNLFWCNRRCCLHHYCKCGNSIFNDNSDKCDICIKKIIPRKFICLKHKIKLFD